MYPNYIINYMGVIQKLFYLLISEINTLHAWTKVMPLIVYSPIEVTFSFLAVKNLQRCLLCIQKTNGKDIKAETKDIDFEICDFQMIELYSVYILLSRL